MRLRRADWLILLGGLAAPATLWFDWFKSAPTTPPIEGGVAYAPLDAGQPGWSSLGWPTLVLIVATALLGLAVVVLIASGARDAVNLPPAVVLAALTPLTLLVTLIVTLMKPGGATGIETGAWIGLGALAVLHSGAWFSIRDERVDQPSRYVEPPPARPAPPAS